MLIITDKPIIPTTAADTKGGEGLLVLDVTSADIWQKTTRHGALPGPNAMPLSRKPKRIINHKIAQSAPAAG